MTDRVGAAKQAILLELERDSPLSWEEVPERLAGFSTEEVNAAAAELDSESRVIVGMETDGRPSEIDFSFLVKNAA
jgi:hypothetical protein